jgi:hypothetical protein
LLLTSLTFGSITFGCGTPGIRARQRRASTGCCFG